jgi:hypothetical protein
MDGDSPYEAGDMRQTKSARAAPVTGSGFRVYLELKEGEVGVRHRSD